MAIFFLTGPLLAGLLLALTSPKFNLWPLAWLALVPFFLALYYSRGKKRVVLSASLFGLIYFGLNLFWVTSLFRFVGWWAVIGWIFLVLFQTIFIILFGLGFWLLRARRLDWLLIPALWVMVEWLRAWGPFGVTAGDLGYSQAGCLPLIQMASFATVYGVSFSLVMFNLVLARFIVDRRHWPALLISMVLIMAAFSYGAVRLHNHKIDYTRLPKIALLQPNIEQMDKMSVAKIPAVYAVHEELTSQAAAKGSRFIVWPETAIFSYLVQDVLMWPKVQALAKETGTWLIIGTSYYEGVSKRIYNSITVVSPWGKVISRYDKQQLVPFGEYLPFRRLLLPFLKQTGYFYRDFNPGRPSPNLSAGCYLVAGAVCFESTFPELISRAVKKETDFILVVTNDGWFGDSAAPYVHLQGDVFRAVENDRFLLQAANTGISAIIDPCGRIIKQSQLNRREIIISGQ